jgi:Mrp family chromosome partitioning ATPase
MIGGTVPGAGKTTLMRALAAALDASGTSACMTLTEDEVWGERQLGLGSVDHSSARPEFAALLDSAERLRSGQPGSSSSSARPPREAVRLVHDLVAGLGVVRLAGECLDDRSTPTAAVVTTALRRVATALEIRPMVLFCASMLTWPCDAP